MHFLHRFGAKTIFFMHFYAFFAPIWCKNHGFYAFFMHFCTDLVLFLVFMHFYNFFIFIFLSSYYALITINIILFYIFIVILYYYTKYIHLRPYKEHYLYKFIKCIKIHKMHKTFYAWTLCVCFENKKNFNFWTFQNSLILCKKR